MFQSQTQNVLPIDLFSDGIIGRYLILDHQYAECDRTCSNCTLDRPMPRCRVISSSVRLWGDVFHVISNSTHWLKVLCNTHICGSLGSSTLSRRSSSSFLCAISEPSQLYG